MEALKPRTTFDADDPIWKRKPFVHQQEMARFHYENPCSGDASDVGTGKTQGIIATIQRLISEKQVSRCLIICPNTILDNWAAELVKNSDLSWVILRGPRDKRIALLQQSKLVDVYLINYEGVRVISSQLMAANFDMIVCDEVHHIKSWNSIQSKLILKLAKDAPYRKGMTGTLLTNDIQDLWSVCQFIDPSMLRTNYWGFRNKYLYNENGNKPWMKWPRWVPKDGAVEELKKRIEPWFIRFEKRSVLKFLPPVLFQKRVVTLSEEQRKVYAQLKRDFVVELESGEELAALHILSRVQKLLEITSGFAYRENEPTIRFSNNAKLNELKAVLEEIGKQRVVVWCSFREDAAMICEALTGLGEIGQITGDTKQENRQAIVDQFNRGEIQYLVCNASCAGEGISLYTPYSIYYSRGWKLGEREQSLGRHDRPGSEQFSNVTIIDLVAADTVDEEVMKALETKKDLLKSITPQYYRRMLAV